MFKFVFHLICSLDNDVQSQWIEVHLRSQETRSFRDWILKLENDQTLPFEEDGTLRLNLPRESMRFEVLDAERNSRFQGSWAQYGTQKIIVLDIGDGREKHNVAQMVVSASRVKQDAWEVPGEVEVIKPSEQGERSTTQTSDWLKEQAEVLLQKTNLGGGSPIMRGMSGNRILLMVDGFKLNNAIFRLGLNQYLNTTPAAQVEQIEVLSGPSGVQYGSDGLGGTIHLRSKDPGVDSEPNLEYSGLLSTADGTHTHRIAGSGGKGNLFLSGHFNLNRYEDLEAADPVGEQVPTGYEGWDGSLRLSYEIDQDRRLRLLNSDSQATHVPRTDRVQSGQDLLWEYHPQKLRLHGLRYEARQNAVWADQLDLGLGYLRQDEGTRRIPSGDPDRLSEERVLVDTWQLNGTFTKSANRVQWIYGFDVQLDEVASSGANSDLITGTRSDAGGKFPDDAAYSIYGTFLVSEIEVRNRQKLRIGLRQSWAQLEGTLAQPIGRVDQSYEQLTPSLTWSWTGSRDFVSLGASQGFRAPNLEDALALGPTNRGFDAPNPGLEPEELWSYEVNYRRRMAGHALQASTYTSRYSSLIERVPGSYQGEDTFEGEQVFILDNVGKAKVDGVSLAYQYEWAKQRVRADGSWTKGTQTDRDEPMTRIPPLRGNLGWFYRTEKLDLSALFTWADRQDRLSPGDIDDSRIPVDGTPGYGVLHLRGKYQVFDALAVKLALENVGDKLYKYHGSGIFEPGRRLLLELEARWR